MNILHVIPSFHPATVYGGPVESVYRLCVNLRRVGCQVRVLTTNANGPERVLDVPAGREITLPDGVPVRYCPRWFAVSVSPDLLRRLPACIRWADVVHLTAVYSFPTIPSLLMSRVLRKPVVWSPRGALQRWRGSTRIRAKRFWEGVCRHSVPDRILLHATSPEEARESEKRFPGLGVVVIPNGVEVPETLAPSPGNGSLRLLYIGRLHEKKGIENLFLACRRLADGGTLRWSLTVAGSGNPVYAESLRSRITDLGLEDRIRMVGEVSGREKSRLYEDSDLAVVPSHTENFGMVVAEALAHSVPVIASRGTPWERVEEVGCGLWVDNSPESLCRAIESISRLPLFRMGECGRQWMQAEFTWRSRAEQMARAYRSLLGPAVGSP